MSALTLAEALSATDILREPGRVSVDKAKLIAAMEELERERRLAVERFALTVRLRIERDEARKELVRVRAEHRMTIEDLERASRGAVPDEMAEVDLDGI